MMRLKNLLRCESCDRIYEMGDHLVAGDPCPKCKRKLTRLVERSHAEKPPTPYEF